MKPSPETSPKARCIWRSLIGWLVIVSLIAMLAVLLYPYLFVPEPAKKVTAHNDETQIVNAVHSYYAEYGKYPVPSTMSRGTYHFSTDNNVLFDVLRNRTGSKSGNPLNPHGIVFMELPAARNQERPKSGLQISTGVFYDPWGSPYHIAIDADESGELNGKDPIPGFYSDVGPLKTGVIVWSYGENGQLGGGPAADSNFSSESGKPGIYKGSGDVVSWW